MQDFKKWFRNVFCFWWCLLVFLSFFLVRWSNGNHRRQEEGRYYISSSVSFLRAREKTPTLSTTRGLIHLEPTVTCWNIYSFGRKHGGREERQVSVDHRGAFKSSFFLLFALSTTVGLSVCGRIGRIFATSFARSLGVARSEFRRTSFIFARMKDSGGIFSSAM